MTAYERAAQGSKGSANGQKCATGVVEVKSLCAEVCRQLRIDDCARRRCRRWGPVSAAAATGDDASLKGPLRRGGRSRLTRRGVTASDGGCVEPMLGCRLGACAS